MRQPLSGSLAGKANDEGGYMTKVHVNDELVKHLRKSVKEHGFRDVLYALAQVAGKRRGAAWGFLAFELKDIAHDEVPE